MGSLTVNHLTTPTLTGVMLATALGSMSFNTSAHQPNLPVHEYTYNRTSSRLDLNSTMETFTSVQYKSSDNSQELGKLIVNVFEKVASGAAPLSDDFAKILSDNILDLF